MRLVLNFSPIQFDDQEIRVGRLPYGNDGEQLLQQLREEHNRTHVFRREGPGPDSILAVSVSPGASLIGEPDTIRLKDHLKLAAALIRNTLLNRLVELGGVSGLRADRSDLSQRPPSHQLSCGGYAAGLARRSYSL